MRLSNRVWYTHAVNTRTVKELFKSKEVMEGAGVRLHRVFSQPEVPKFDPFLLLDDFGSENPDDYLKGFPWHPHRGIETVTYMKRGEVEHQDSLGNKGTIRAGDVQWMTAGSGIIHQEMPQFSEEPLQGLQLWVNLPRDQKMSTPRYRGITKDEIPLVEKEIGSVKVIAGLYDDVMGPTDNLSVDVRYLDVSLKEGAEFSYILPAHFTAFIYVYSGSVQIGGDAVVREEYAALTNDGEKVACTSIEGRAQFIFVAGEPVGEPVAWGGPIVMNTEAELHQAFTEIHNGTFIKEK